MTHSTTVVTVRRSATVVTVTHSTTVVTVAQANACPVSVCLGIDFERSQTLTAMSIEPAVFSHVTPCRINFWKEMYVSISLEDGASGFLRNAGTYLPDYTTSHRRRPLLYHMLVNNVRVEETVGLKLTCFWLDSLCSVSNVRSGAFCK
jgi:hypothetical protein